MDDHDRDEPGAGHLEQVVVLEVPRDLPDGHRRPALRLQVGIQRDQALPDAAVLAGVDVLPRKVVDRGDLGGARAGHHDLAHVRASGPREIHDRLQLRPDDDLRHRAVDLACRQRRAQLVARHRHERDGDLRRTRPLELLVEVILERLPQLVGHAPLLALVHEVEGAIEGAADADHPARHHLVEVAGERLEQMRPHALRQRGLLRGRRQGLVCRRCRGGDRHGRRLGSVGRGAARAAAAAPDGEARRARECQSTQPQTKRMEFEPSEHDNSPVIAPSPGRRRAPWGHEARRGDACASGQQLHRDSVAPVRAHVKGRGRQERAPWRVGSPRSARGIAGSRGLRPPRDRYCSWDLSVKFTVSVQSARSEEQAESGKATSRVVTS